MPENVITPTSSISNLSETLTCFAKASFANFVASSTLDCLDNKIYKDHSSKRKHEQTPNSTNMIVMIFSRSHAQVTLFHISNIFTKLQFHHPSFIIIVARPIVNQSIFLSLILKKAVVESAPIPVSCFQSCHTVWFASKLELSQTKW